MEKEKETAKIVALNSQEKPTAQQPQKLTYEQLNETCAQLYQQNQNLLHQLQQMNLTNMFRRLDYLFKILEHSIMFNQEFVNSCAQEIEAAMRVQEPDSNTESHEQAQ